MSLHAFQRSYGPAKRSRLDLMGIRFAEVPGDGSGAGGGEDKSKDDKGGDGYKPPTSQEDLDKLINAAVARTHKKYEGHDDLKAQLAALQKAEQDKGKTPDQKAIDDALEQGRAEVRAVLAEERVNNALTAALTGRVLDPNVLVLGFDKKQFISGETADAAAIKEWVEKNSTEAPKGQKKVPGQGDRDATANGGSVQAGRDLYDSQKKPTRKE